MNTDDFDEALEDCVRETGVERYRHLTSEANKAMGRISAAEYRRWILERGWRRRVTVDYSAAGPLGRCGGCR